MGDPTPLAPVLYAEDDENDVFFMQRAFKKAGVNHPLLIARNGSRAVELLQSFGENRSHPRPALALLDLKMPHLSGLDVLRWVRTESNLKDLPIALYTSSTQQRDVQVAYELGANAYLVKPANPDQLIELVRELREACLQQTPVTGWLHIPSNPPPPR